MSKQKRTYYTLLILLISFVIITWIVKIINDILPYTDQVTRSFVESVEGTPFFTFARLVTDLGSSPFLVPFVIIMSVILLIVHRNILPTIIFIGGTSTSGLFNIIIKQIVERERPRLDVLANAEGFSYPSGHAMVSIVCYGLLVYLLMLKINSLMLVLIIEYSFALLILAIGMSRVIINVHYLTDVLSGFIFGFLILLGFIKLYHHLINQRLAKDKSK